jgi:hypothetical protein
MCCRRCVRGLCRVAAVVCGGQGVHCRFGMSGIIAEAHFDGGRNMVALVQGKRRYILLAPDQCRCACACPS